MCTIRYGDKEFFQKTKNFRGGIDVKSKTRLKIVRFWGVSESLLGKYQRLSYTEL